jgi:hypothetical protein
MFNFYDNEIWKKITPVQKIMLEFAIKFDKENQLYGIKFQLRGD